MVDSVEETVVPAITFRTSLLRRLQAQTLRDATPPICKIYPFTKMAVCFEPVMRFDALQDLESSLSL